MEKKLLNFEERLGINDFKASPYWMSATLKRNKNFGIHLNGKANDMTDEETEMIMSAKSHYGGFSIFSGHITSALKAT